MGKITESWEPFDIWVTIEGKIEKMLVIPDREESKYELFDEYTSVGRVWTEQINLVRVWCAEGVIARELLDQISEQIDLYNAWADTEQTRQKGKDLK